ncbi:MAG: type III-B CRISPR module RAMP protein Cmr6 [bacterium]
MATFRSNHFRLRYGTDQISDHFNLGLLYYKYSPFFENDKKKINIPGLPNLDKIKFLKEYATLSRKTGSSQLNKRMQIIKDLPNVTKVPLTTQSRFLCGVGYQSRVEWGFSFDWTTGIPYLPGSSWKGALLSYLEFCHPESLPVERWQDGNDRAKLDNSIWEKNEIIEIFGPQGESIAHPAMGKTTFFNAYPTNFKGFEVDIITPHYKEYYENPQTHPPADIYNPVPIPFLTLPKGTTFAFCFKFRNDATEQEKEKLKQLIREAGENYGFGAKTATGYGYFQANELNL